MPIPALLNPEAGSAARARAALRADRRFHVCEVKPADIAAAVREEAARGTRRMLISGGDGTLSAAVGAAAGTPLEIAVFPGGTLNHFARDYGIPLDDPRAALDIAANGIARPMDLGYVNGHVILNTSSVGVYPEFVRRREDLEQRLNYPLATVAAAADVWRDPQALTIDLQTDEGAQHPFRTPLLFVGVHERVLERSRLGVRRARGARALHILVVKQHTRSGIHALAPKAVARGVDGLVSENDIESHLTTKATVTMPTASCVIAIDGELLEATSPLRYQFVPGAVKVVQP